MWIKTVDDEAVNLDNIVEIRATYIREHNYSVVELYSLPPVFGKRLTDTDTIAFVSHKAGITENDWQRLKDSAQIEVKG